MGDYYDVCVTCSRSERSYVSSTLSVLYTKTLHTRPRLRSRQTTCSYVGFCVPRTEAVVAWGTLDRGCSKSVFTAKAQRFFAKYAKKNTSNSKLCVLCVTSLCSLRFIFLTFCTAPG